MAFSPFLILSTWILGLASLALLGGGLYVLWLWYVGAVVASAYLVAGCAGVIWTFAGRPIVLALWRRPGPDEPRALRSRTVQRIDRPDGAGLHVELDGQPDGPTIVLTHGWGTDSTEWYYLRRALAGRYRLILWDLPGLGRSHGPKNGDYRIETMAGHLAAVAALAGEQPVILLGHSIGGMITQTFWRLSGPEVKRRVAGLALVNTTYTNPTRTTTFRRFFRAVQGPLLTPLLYLTIGLSPLIWLMNWLSFLNGFTHIQTGLTGFTGHETRGQLDFTARFTPLFSPAVLARGALATFQFDEAATLPGITVPTLVVTGNLDRVLIPEASALIARTVPTATLQTLHPAGHMGLLEQHTHLDELVERFCDDCFDAVAPAWTEPFRNRA
jgi:pimeloyl-ACP methyl ester carboxylesterase